MTIREIWNTFKTLRKCKNPHMLAEVIDLLKDSKQNIILTRNSDDSNIVYYTSDENLDVKFAVECRELMRNDLKRRVGDETYDRDMEFFEPFTAQVFMEADYQMARADAAEMELEYVKRINDPTDTTDGPELYRIWKDCQDAKEKLKHFEEIAEQQQQQNVPQMPMQPMMPSMGSGIPVMKPQFPIK